MDLPIHCRSVPLMSRQPFDIIRPSRLQSSRTTMADSQLPLQGSQLGLNLDNVQEFTPGREWRPREATHTPQPFDFNSRPIRCPPNTANSINANELKPKIQEESFENNDKLSYVTELSNCIRNITKLGERYSQQCEKLPTQNAAVNLLKDEDSWDATIKSKDATYTNAFTKFPFDNRNINNVINSAYVKQSNNNDHIKPPLYTTDKEANPTNRNKTNYISGNNSNYSTNTYSRDGFVTNNESTNTWDVFSTNNKPSTSGYNPPNITNAIYAGKHREFSAVNPNQNFIAAGQTNYTINKNPTGGDENYHFVNNNINFVQNNPCSVPKSIAESISNRVPRPKTDRSIYEQINMLRNTGHPPLNVNLHKDSSAGAKSKVSMVEIGTVFQLMIDDKEGSYVILSKETKGIEVVNLNVKSKSLEISQLSRMSSSVPDKARLQSCSFCKKNGERKEVYLSHSLSDGNKNVVCPVLYDHKCELCGATGPRAHTISYCPLWEGNIDGKHTMPPSLVVKTSMRKSNGKYRDPSKYNKTKKFEF